MSCYHLQPIFTPRFFFFFNCMCSVSGLFLGNSVGQMESLASFTLLPSVLQPRTARLLIRSLRYCWLLWLYSVLFILSSRIAVLEMAHVAACTSYVTHLLKHHFLSRLLFNGLIQSNKCSYFSRNTCICTHILSVNSGENIMGNSWESLIV